MATVERVDLSAQVLDIWRDSTVSVRQRVPGPPERVDGMTFGVVTMQPGQSPHNGEMHPDGDEILYVISGTLRVEHDSGEHPLELSMGEACIVRKGEWHKVVCTQETTLLHVTPGPNGEARF